MSDQTDTKQPLYIFAGGGTGGHLAPGIAVAEELRREQPDCRIRFVGSGRPVERQMLEPTGFEYSVREVLPLNAAKRRPFQFMRTHWRAFRESCQKIDRDRPTAIVGLGGFASVPLALAAKKKRVPCVLLEQNTVPGKANRWLSRWHPVCLTFEESARFLPARANSNFTGNPLRQEIRQLSSSTRELPLEKPTLLILGGSLGSRQVNESILTAVAGLSTEFSGWKVIHQTGPEGVEAARAVYEEHGIAHEVEPFFADLPARLASTTLAVARAGATTLSELAAVGIPAVLIPYPASADDHQMKNAEYFERADAAVIAAPPDRSFAAVDLAPALQPLLTDRTRLTEMGHAMRRSGMPEASIEVVRMLRSLLK